MEITPWELYALLKLDSIITLFRVICVLSAIFSIIFIIASADVRENSTGFEKRAVKRVLPAVLLFVFSLTCSHMIPTTKQMATIFVLPKLINSELVQKDIPEEAKEIYSLCKQYLKNQVDETKEKKDVQKED